VAFVGFIFLFFLVFCLYFAWKGFFFSNDQKTTNEVGSLEESPEWRAFLNRRQEIETDPTLDTSSKQVLIDNWLTMASESKPHMASAAVVSPLRPSWARPNTMSWLIVASLGFAVLFTYLIGAIHPGALKWPEANSVNVSRTGLRACKQGLRSSLMICVVGYCWHEHMPPCPITLKVRML
jgi:hypothetical protein